MGYKPEQNGKKENKINIARKTKCIFLTFKSRFVTMRLFMFH